MSTVRGRKFICEYCEKHFHSIKACKSRTPRSCNSSKGTLTLLEFSEKIQKPKLIEKHINLCIAIGLDIPEYETCCV